MKIPVSDLAGEIIFKATKGICSNVITLEFASGKKVRFQAYIDNECHCDDYICCCTAVPAILLESA